MVGVPTTIELAVCEDDIERQQIARRRGTERKDMTSRSTRISALTGVIFVVFLVPAVLVTSGSPNSNASASSVRVYVLAHKSHYSVGALLSILAIVFGLFFYGYLRAIFRSRPGMEWLSTIFFGGAIVFGVGGALAGGIDAVMGDSPASLSASSLQLLNTMAMDLNVAALATGLAILYLSAGFLIYKSGVLPGWLAWVSWLLGVLAGSFLLAFFALAATVLWVLFVSIFLASRNPSLDVSGTESDARGGNAPSLAHT
jgi:hypothetical protein